MIVEDGSGLENANSYVKTEFVDDYLSQRGQDQEWRNAPQEAKEQALVSATDYVELRFSSSFIGCKKSEGQRLSFPREEGVIPLSLKEAISEYAKRAIVSELMPDPESDSSSKMIVSQSQSLGPLSKSTQYSTGYSRVVKRYPTADNKIKHLTRRNGGVYR